MIIQKCRCLDNSYTYLHTFTLICTEDTYLESDKTLLLSLESAVQVFMLLLQLNWAVPDAGKAETYRAALLTTETLSVKM
jgi:hypothetical protein